MADKTPQLPAASLFDARTKKDKARLSAYNQILEQVLHKVAFSAGQPSQPTFVYYNIPPFVLGLPNIDLQDCVHISEFVVDFVGASRTTVFTG